MPTNSPNRPKHKRGPQSSKAAAYTPPPQDRGVYKYGRPNYRQRSGAAKLPGSK